MRTLHTYLARELAKTFILTSAALTVLIVMGGGVANVFRSEGIGAKEMATVFVFLAPVAVTMILPVAALFSATITYGRASADNEMVACRAAGINIQRLLLSAGLLGLLVTVATYTSWNFVIPRLSERIERLTQRDLPSIVVGQFRRNKALTFRNYRICADSFEELNGDRRPPDALEDHTYLWLKGVAFLELQDDQPVQYGTADRTIIDFDRSLLNPRVTIVLRQVRTFDVGRGHDYKLQQLSFGPYSVPLPLKRKMKFQDLPTLRWFLADPKLIPEMSDRLFRVKRGMMEQYLFDDIARNIDKDLGGSGEYRLYVPDGTTYDISAAGYKTSNVDNEPTLRQAVVVERRPDGAERVRHAGQVHFDLKNTLDREKPQIIVTLSDGVRDERPGERAFESPSETLPPLQFVDQPALQSRVEQFDPDEVLNPGVEQRALPRKLAEARKKLLRRMAQFESEVTGEIHFRASYSLSAVAVVLIGAMLGVVLRGGQVLTAFGISCLPTAFVVVASIVGRNLADQPGGAPAALAVMWGATAVTYAAAGVIASRVLRL
ncbi:MAG: LptF/LptG family permease [Phycisphaerae bacterium]